jgi:hypothetical protein
MPAGVLCVHVNRTPGFIGFATRTMAVWTLIAALQTILTEHAGDPYIKGALRLAKPQSGAM